MAGGVAAAVYLPGATDIFIEVVADICRVSPATSICITIVLSMLALLVGTSPFNRTVRVPEPVPVIFWS